MGHQKQWAFGAVALQAGDEVEAVGVAAQQFTFDAFLPQFGLDVLGDERLVAGGVGGVEPEEIDEVALGAVFERFRGYRDGTQGEKEKPHG